MDDLDVDFRKLSFDFSKVHISRNQIQEILMGMKPVNLDLYRQALIHSSLGPVIEKLDEFGIKYQEYMKANNERLEFLGDSFFNAIVTHIIYEKYPDKDEGFLTRIKIKLVRDTHCTRMAKHLCLDNFILTKNKVLGIFGKQQVNNKLLEDCFEAFIGALYLDLGFKYAEHFVRSLVAKYVDFNELLKDDNYKDILMRYAQACEYELPIYNTVSIEGTGHNRQFNVEVIVLDKYTGEKILNYKGFGKSKKEAEIMAAKNACDKIDKSMTHIINRDSFQ